VEDVSLCRAYRPEPLRSIPITGTSSLLWAHPRILFACWTSFSTYINSPYWIGLSQLLLTELLWLASTHTPIGRLTAYVHFFIKRYSLPHLELKGWHQ
jgi:hypothetical protein